MADSKCLLNEYCQKHRMGQPEYDTNRSGSGFKSVVTLEGIAYPSPTSQSTKKAAEKDAASEALQALKSKTAGQLYHQPPSLALLRLRKVLPSSTIPPSIPFDQRGRSSSPEQQIHISRGGASPRSPSVTPPGSPPPLIGAGGRSVSPYVYRGAVREPPKHNFESKLEMICQSRGLSLPAYSVKEKSGRFTAHVDVGGEQYGGSSSYESFELAKENATLTALACIGLEALSVADEGNGSASARSGFNEAATPPRFSAQCQSVASSVREDRSNQENKSTPERRSLWSYPQSPIPAGVSLRGSTQLEDWYSEARGVDSRPHPLSSSACLQTPAFFGSANTRTVSQSINSQGTGVVVLSKTSMSNYKVSLNTYCQKEGIPAPHYECSYPEDEVGYIATVKIQGQVFTSGPQGTKRAAESLAAAQALRSLGEGVGENVGGATNGHAAGGGIPASLAPVAAVSDSDRNVSYKNLLQEYLQKSYLAIPVYDTERTEEGFVSTVAVKLDSEEAQHFTGRAHTTKKAAEQDSAKVACQKLKLLA